MGMNAAPVRRAPYPVRTDHKQCMKCGKLVARAAFVCRRCGKRQRVRPRTVVLALTSGAILAMFAVASASALLTPPRPVETTPTWPKAAAAPTIVKAAAEVTATELRAAYALNPVEADRQFRYKSVIVNGVVMTTERDFEGNMIARLSTGDALETVNAKLATRNDPTLVGVIKGRSVSLLCVGRGSIMGAPQLAGCFVR